MFGGPIFLNLGVRGFLVFDILLDCFNVNVENNQWSRHIQKLPKIHSLIFSLFIGIGTGDLGMFKPLAFKIQNIIFKDLGKGR